MNHYINFTNHPDRCASDLGYMLKVGQNLNLGYGCMFKGDIMHEVLHALGFIHQHNSPNRDNFITVHLTHILEGKEPNFDKANDSEVVDDEEYDFRSVMHYGTHDFTWVGEPTITTINGEKIGQRKELSEIDISKINKMYNCTVSK